MVEKEKRSTADRVVATATEMIAAAGYERLDMFGLSQASGVSNGSIYHHFGSREGVLVAVLDRIFHRYALGLSAVLRRHPEDAEGGIRAMVSFELSWAAAHSTDARTLLRHRDAFLRGTRTRHLHNLTLSIDHWLADQAGAGRMPRLRAPTAMAIVLAPATEVARAWLEGRDTPPLEAYATCLGDAAWAAVLAVEHDPAV